MKSVFISSNEVLRLVRWCLTGLTALFCLFHVLLEVERTQQLPHGKAHHPVAGMLAHSADIKPRLSKLKPPSPKLSISSKTTKEDLMLALLKKLTRNLL
jgi:hypothetical protein